MTSPIYNFKNEYSRINGIDYLRAVCSVFVVVWHMRGGGQSLLWSKDRLLDHTFTASDFLNFHILLLAVPTFIFISTFLYAFKGPSKEMLMRRLKRLFILITFWPITFIYINRGGIAGFRNIIPKSVYWIVQLVLTAGWTAYYFFVSLIICLLITHFVIKMKTRFQIIGFVLSVIILTFLPEAAKIIGIYKLSCYWNPLNFIPFSFAAIFFAKRLDYIQSRRTILLAVSIILCVIFALFEWKYYIDARLFEVQAFAIPAYTRASIVWGVFALAIIAFNPSIKPNAIVKFMSRYSLALYCLHLFFMEPTTRLVTRLTQNNIVIIYGSIILLILLSYITAMIIRNYLKEKVLF
jgi:peptidoglycan/LPS O-acetylase OafA/YrhL